MSAGSLYFLGPKHLRHYRREKNNWKGFVCIFTDEFTTATNLPNHFADYPFYSLKGNQKLQLREEEIVGFQKRINALYLTFNSGKLDNCWHQLHIILNEAKDLYYQKFNEEVHEPEADLVIQFNSELESHFFNIASGNVEHLYSVNDFAGRLYVHPNHLSKILKKYTGRTAGQIIRERVIVEAKSLLQSTEMSVSQVAFTLCFNDTSYFTKYFKKSVGMTPIKFQEKHNNK
nr:response regulator transcription factor [Aquimarina sp. U1-2]